jgi:flagellar hook-associated protein 2
VSDAVDGVTIKLLSASPGETARLNVEIDVAGVRDAIENFVFTYNSLQSTLSNLTSYDPTTKIGGPLLGDSMVLLFQDQLRREVGESVSKFTFDFDSLVDLGITTNLEDGTLEIDDAELDAQLSGNFDRVAELFAGENGYATRLQALADTYLETDGFIEVRNDGIQKSIEGIEADLLQLNEHLAAYEARLRRQFTALDTLVGQLTATSEFLAQQLALLPGFETKAAS